MKIISTTSIFYIKNLVMVFWHPLIYVVRINLKTIDLLHFCFKFLFFSSTSTYLFFQFIWVNRILCLSSLTWKFLISCIVGVKFPLITFFNVFFLFLKFLFEYGFNESNIFFLNPERCCFAPPCLLFQKVSHLGLRSLIYWTIVNLTPWCESEKGKA